MGYAQYIGRIGALAVALGVTSAVAHPQLALAEEPSSTGSSDAGTASPDTAPPSGPTDKTEATTKDDSAEPSGGDEDADAPQSPAEPSDGEDDADSPSTAEPAAEDATSADADAEDATQVEPTTTTHADTDTEAVAPRRETTDRSPAQAPDDVEPSTPAADDDLSFTTRALTVAGLDDQSLDSPIPVEPVVPLAKTLSTSVEQSVDATAAPEVAEVPPLESLALGVLGVLGGAGLDPTGTADEALLAAAWALYRRQESSADAEDAIDEPADVPEIGLGVEAATFALLSTPANEAPTAVNDTKAMTQGVPRTFSPVELLSNDTDPERDALRVHSVADAVGGTAVLNADGTVTFTPTAGFNGAAAFTYIVEDAAGSVSANSATVTLNIRPNSAPVPTDDTKLLVQNVSRTFAPGELTYNDIDLEHDALRVHSVADAVGGSVVLNADGTVTFTPETDYTGSASFTYQVKDIYGLVGSNAATVILTVRANTAPTAADDTKLVVQNVPRTLAPDELTYNDTDPEGDPRSIHSVDNAVGGTVVLNADGTVTFTPAPDYNGPASFTYRAKDSYGLAGNSATVALTVRANTAPTAGDDSKLLVENVSRTFVPGELTYNDTDPERDWRILHSVDNAVGGTVVLNADGTVTFTPEADYSGDASFTYQVKDSYGLVSNSATVALTVRPNTAPTPVDDAKIMVEDTPRTFVAGELTYNDIDAEHDARSIHSVTGATGGTAVLNADGTVTFTPAADYNGLASFTYQVKDIYGAVSATSATVNLTILPVDDPDTGNHAPDAGTPAYQYTTQLRSGILSGTVTVADQDGDTLSFELANTPSAGIGSVVIDSATGAWAFRPTSQARLDAWTNPDGLGVHFTVIASDGQASTPVEINVQVSPAAFFDAQSADLGLAGPDQVIAVSADGHVYLDGVGGLSVLNPDGSAGSEIPLDFTPTDAAVGSDGRIYATDHENGVVVVIDPADSSVTSLASLSNPGGVAVDAAGKLYVTSSEDRTLTILNGDGSVVNAFQLDSIPTDVAVGPQGQIYVGEIAEDLNSVRVTLRNADGSVAKVLYTSDSAPLGDYASPLGIAVGVNGAVYVSDPNQARFAAFDKDGEPADSLYLDGIGRGIAVTANGVVLLTNSLDGSLWALTAGTLENGDFDYTVDRATGVVSGEVFVLDPGGQFTYEVSTAPDPLLGTVTIDSNTGAWEFTPTADASFNAWLGQYDSSVDYQSEAEFAIIASDGTQVLVSAPIVGVANFDVDVITGVNGSPVGIALGSDGRIYVADRAGNSITVLNNDGTALATVDLNFTPLGVSAGPGGLIIITNGVDNTLAILNTSSGYTVSSTTVTGFPGAITAAAFSGTGGVIVVGQDADLVAAFLSPTSPVFTVDVDNPTAIDIGSDGDIYVVGTDDDGAGYLNVYGSDGTLLSSITLGGNPSGVSVGPTGLVYVTDANGLPRSLAIVGPDGLLSSTLELGGPGWGVEASPDGRVYIANPGDGSVTVLTPPEAPEPAGPIGTLSTITTNGMSALAAIAVTQDGQLVVTGSGYGTGFALGIVGETGTITNVASLGTSYSFGVEVGPDGQFYVSDYVNGTVTAYDPANGYAGRVVATIPGALGLAFDNDGTLYVTSINLGSATSTLNTVDSAGNVAQVLAVPGAAYDVTVAPDGRVFASYYSPTGAGSGILVRELDGTTSTITLPAGTIPVGVAVDADGTVYVTDTAHGTVVAQYASGLTRSVPVGGQPFGLALDDVGHLYITSPQSGKITVLKLAGYANTAPTVSDPHDYTVGPGGVVSGQVSSSDPDRDTLTYSLAAQVDPAIGTATVDPSTGTWSFTPTLQARLAAAEAWNDPTIPDHTVTLTISASDGQYADTVSIEVTIYPEIAPVAGTPAFSITDTNTINGWVTGQINVSDADGDDLGYELASTIDPADGTVAVDSSTGSWTFAPTKAKRVAAGVSPGDDVFVFNVNVSDGTTNVTVAVSAPVIPTVSTTPQLGTPAFTIISTDPSYGLVYGTVNVSDADSDTLSYSLAAAVDSTIGAVTVDSGTGTWTFVPTSAAREAAYNTPGDDTVTFTVDVADDEHIVSVAVTAPISPATGPVAGTPAFTITSTGPDGQVSGYLNVADPDGDWVTYQLTTAPDPNVGNINYVSYYYGNWTFIPTAQARLDAASTAGDDTTTFVITASDGIHTTDITITVPVIPNLVAPVAGTPAFSIETLGQDGVVYGTVNVSDPDGDSITYQLTTAPDPTLGYVNYNYWGGSWTFTPTAQARLDAASTAGEDTTTFVITASDGTHTTDITITAPITPNAAAPEPGTPAYTITSTGQDGVVYGSVNATDPDNDTVTYQLTTAPDPTIGYVYADYWGGSWTFVPTAQARLDAANTTGDDTTTFVITASDGGRATDITVTAPIIPNAAAPVAGTPAFTIDGTGDWGAVYGRLNVTDTDGDTVTYQFASASLDPNVGAVWVNGYDGSWSFTPTAQARLDAAAADGDTTVTFSITATDGLHQTDVPVAVTISPNAAPLAGDPAFTVTGNGAFGAVYGQLNVTDREGGQLTYQLTSATVDPNLGRVELDSATGLWTFTPTSQARVEAAATEGSDSITFSVEVSDGQQSATVPVNIDITPNAAAPQKLQPAFGITEIADVTGVVRGTIYVTDLDDPVLIYSLTSTDGSGHVTVNADGTFIYAPNSKARQIASVTTTDDVGIFVVTATDGVHDPVSVTVTAPITPASNFAVDSLYAPWGNQGLAVSPDGRAYFTTYLVDDTAGEVVVLDPDGTYVTTIDFASAFSFAVVTAYDVVVGPDGRVFVSGEIGDTTDEVAAENGHGIVAVIDPDAEYAVSVFAQTSDPASALAIDSSGRVFVANWNNDSISVFNPDGNLLKVIESNELADGDDTGVAGLGLGTDDLLYLSKPWFGVVKVVNFDGSLADVFDVGGNPWAVDVSPIGNIYVTDSGTDLIHVLAPNGAVIRTITIGNDASLSDITVGNDGTVYAPYTNSDASSIAIITAASEPSPDATQFGDRIPGQPEGTENIGSPVVGTDVVYQATTHTDPSTGMPVSMVAVIQPDGSTTLSNAPGDQVGTLVLGPGERAYQTVSYFDTTTLTYQSGVLIVSPDGDSSFTGLVAGEATGSVVFGSDGTAYQALYAIDSDTGAYTTTVLAITPSGAHTYTIDGFPGGAVSDASGAVVAPDGTVLLTTTAATDFTNPTTTVAILSPTGYISYTATGFASGPVTVAADGTVLQTLIIPHTDTDAENTSYATAVAVLTEAGLVTLPNTVDGLPMGSPVESADGSIFLTLVTSEVEPETGVTSNFTTIASITDAGLAVQVQLIPGLPTTHDGSPIPLIIGNDGTIYLTTTQFANSDSDATTTSVTAISSTNLIYTTKLPGEPSGAVVLGTDGVAYLTTFDTATGKTMVTAISPAGTPDTYAFDGYPGDLESPGTTFPLVVGPNSTVYQTISSASPAGGQYTTTVVIVTDNGVYAPTFAGSPSGGVVNGPDGTAYQTVRYYDYQLQSYFTRILAVSTSDLTQVGDPIHGTPAGTVTIGSQGQIYQTVYSQDGTDPFVTTVHIVSSPNNSNEGIALALLEFEDPFNANEPDQPAFQRLLSVAAASSNYWVTIDDAYLVPFLVADPTFRFAITSAIVGIRGQSYEIRPMSEEEFAAFATSYHASTGIGTEGFGRTSQGILTYTNSRQEDVLVIYAPNYDQPVSGAILVHPGKTVPLPKDVTGLNAAAELPGSWRNQIAWTYRGEISVPIAKSKNSVSSPSGSANQVTYPTTLSAIAARNSQYNPGLYKYHVDKVSGTDGQARVIVYIGGGDVDEVFEARGLFGLGGSIDQEILNDINKMYTTGKKPVEILVFGYSAGGVIAQNIAASGKYRNLTLVTFGAPMVKLPGNYTTLHIRVNGDPVVDLFSYSYYQTLNAGNTYSQNILSLQPHSYANYKELAKRFDALTEGSSDRTKHSAVFASLKRFESVGILDSAAGDYHHSQVQGGW